ncbi:MAG: hypothetical protein LH645_13375 [Actinomycetia bacterium]|nr:hypothetical protein [Actinomycetes bacterium]
MTSASAAGPRSTSSTRYPTAGLHDLRVTEPDEQAATTLPSRAGMVRTTVLGAGLVDLVSWGLGEEELVGLEEGFVIDGDVDWCVALSDGFGLVGADLSGRGLAADPAVVRRAATSSQVSTGIDAGVTALPTV